MYEIIAIISTFSGPIPHFLLFFCLAFLLNWWTKEWEAAMLLMVIWSIGAEYMQVYFPRGFVFSATDIWWNLSGSLAGILLVQVAFVLSKMFLITNNNKRKEKKSNGGYG